VWAVGASQAAPAVVEQAGQLLPYWVRCLPILWIPFTFAVSAGMTWFAVRWVMRRGAAPGRGAEDVGGEPEHWTVRAQHRFSVRVAVVAAVFGAVFVGGTTTRVGSLSAIPEGLIDVGACLAVFGGAYWGGYRRGHQKHIRKKSAATVFKDAVLIGVLLLPGYLVVLLLLPVAGWAAAAVGVVAVIVLSWRFAFRLVVWLRLARPADPGLQLRVDKLCERAGEQPVPVWVLDWSMANAVALVYERKLAFSTRCLEVLDDTGTDAIAAHELGHLTEGAWVRAGRLATAPAPLCLLLFFELGVWSLLAFFVWLAFGRVLSARMEQRADREAARLSDPKSYARALCRLHEDALMPAVMGAGASPHGNLYDRMLAVGIQPDFPRPEKPPFGRALAATAGFMIVGLVLAIATRVYQPDSIAGLEIAAALGDNDVPELARAEARGGSIERARIFAEAGMALRPDRPEAVRSLLMVELQSGDCASLVNLHTRLVRLPAADQYTTALWHSPQYAACRAQP